MPNAMELEFISSELVVANTENENTQTALQEAFTQFRLEPNADNFVRLSTRMVAYRQAHEDLKQVSERLLALHQQIRAQR
jgi:hypothetical protein